MNTYDASRVIHVLPGQAIQGPGLLVQHVNGEKYLLRPGVVVLAYVYVDGDGNGGSEAAWNECGLSAGEWINVEDLPAGEALSSEVFPDPDERLMASRGEQFFPTNAFVVCVLP